MAIKAKEFDKVDFIKKLAEADGKIKVLEDEKLSANRNLENEKKINDKLKSDLETATNKVNILHEQVSNLKQSHNQNLDTFDSKFDQIHHQLEQANNEII